MIAWFSSSLIEKDHLIFGCIIYSPQPVTQCSQKETLEREVIPWRQIFLFSELKFLVKLVDQFS